MTRRETMVKKYGSEEAYLAKTREWASKGGKTGGNGLQSLTSEQKSTAGYAGGKARKQALVDKYGEAKAKEMIAQWGKDGMNKRWVDSLSTPKSKEV